MALFKRGRPAPDDEPAQSADEFEYAVDDDGGYQSDYADDHDDIVSDTEASGGPYDEHDAPDDGEVRLDLGSIRLPLPADSQLQIETEPDGPLRALHVLTPNARFTIGAYAAPRSGDLWPEISRELAEQLHGDGARVRRENGEWGIELVAFVDDVLLRFVGVDGPRWMLRAVSAGPKETSAKAAEELRDIVRGTIVVRGDQPMPVRTPLPFELPAEIAQHIEQAKTGEGQPG
ncbi:MAG TPA: DUF3710 domain-containing protein [Pseudonocardiaceae bacterium]|nr:DUF3710 domain-containing protein [Pseudonocardiaceae bacterium]